MAKISGKVLDRNIYADGGYLEKNPLWHTDESPFKVRQILRMLQKDCLNPKTACEVGCGAGEVLKLLQERMDNTCRFWDTTSRRRPSRCARAGPTKDSNLNWPTLVRRRALSSS